MRRTEGFDYCVTRRRATFGLKFFLEHGFVVGLRGAQRIGCFEFGAQGATNELRCGFESAVEKDRAGDCFEHISQQCVLLAPAAFFFSATETKKFAEFQTLRSFGECGRAHEAMFHT